MGTMTVATNTKIMTVATNTSRGGVGSGTMTTTVVIHTPRRPHTPIATSAGTSTFLRTVKG